MQFEENLDTFHEPMKCQDKLMNRVSANQIVAIITSFKHQRAVIARTFLVCVDNGRTPNFSLHLFDDSEFQMESSARFPEIDATDLLEMSENNQNNNTERSTKNWVKGFYLWRAERSEVRKLESNICHVHLFLDATLM